MMKENFLLISDLSNEHLNKNINIIGWIYSVRYHSNIIFIEIMINHCILQCTVKHNKNIEKLIILQSFVHVYGKFIERQDECKTNVFLGNFELKIAKIKVISKCIGALPFNVKKSNCSHSESLEYRYLYLRNIDGVVNIINKKQNIFDYCRKYLKNDKFDEIYTPILCAPSPEGARDYIVPSRINKNKFYALPQSPQQFKQLLMMSGFAKYFQIAPCFRDEDSRKDRYVGEFYQLDVEMITNNKDLLINYAKNLVTQIIKTFYPVLECKFYNISYKESLSQFGSDKPNFNGYTIDNINNVYGVFINNYDEVKVYNTLKKVISNLFTINKNDCKGSAKHLEEQCINVIQTKLDNNAFFIGCLSKTLNENITKLGILIKNLNEHFPKNNKNNDVSVVIVQDFPMFEKDKENNWVFSHNPFCKIQHDGKFNKKGFDYELIISEQFDIVINGIEIGSGSLRNNDYQLLKFLFNKMGYKGKNNVFSKFLECFKFGVPPHGGFAIGLERLLMILEKCQIQDCYAFPLSQSGHDFLLGAPLNMNKKTLKELRLKTLK